MCKPKVAIILGSGGHTVQMLRLVYQLGTKYDYSYIIANTDRTSAKKIRIPGRVYNVFDTRLKSDQILIKIVAKFVPSTLQAIWILLKISFR